MHPTPLTSERLVLSLPTPADVDLMTEYCQDPELTRYVPVPVPYTTESARVFIEQLVPAWWQSGNEFNWAIRRDAGELLGMLGARRHAPESTVFDIGYWLGSPHRGHGFAAEAVRAVVDWLFGQKVATLVTWEAIVGNDASVGVARKAGFRYTDTSPSLGTFRDGSHPLCWHAQLAPSDSAAENAASWQDLVTA